MLLSEPVGKGEDADYPVRRVGESGDPEPLPELGIELGTDDFQVLPNVKPHRWP